LWLEKYSTCMWRWKNCQMNIINNISISLIKLYLLIYKHPDSQYGREVLTLKQQTSIKYVVPLLTHYPDSQYCQEVLTLKQQTSIRYVVPLLTHYPGRFTSTLNTIK
jgi:hypothetical protein